MSTSDATSSQLRLLQILSPTLPVGGYSYSQGLEWAVDAQWVTSECEFEQWFREQIASTLGQQELPLLRRLFHAALSHDGAALERWAQFSLAVRDTAEFRQAERDRAEAYVRILETIAPDIQPCPRDALGKSPLVSIAWFAAQEGVDEQALYMAFAHNWVESLVVTGVKLVPLGQSVGQRVIYDALPLVRMAILHSTQVSDDDIGVSLAAQNMASCAHETQYCRIYRN